jgi:hypothetical protein
MTIENQNTQFDLRTMLGSYRTTLRKTKSGPLVDIARNTLNSGIVGNGLHGPYIQFGQDIALYGLWEALLYAETYENQGHFVDGTLERIAHALVKKLNKN